MSDKATPAQMQLGPVIDVNVLRLVHRDGETYIPCNSSRKGRTSSA
jgi:hypothetical protein